MRSFLEAHLQPLAVPKHCRDYWNALYRISDLAVVGRSALISLSDALAGFIVVSSAVLGR